MRPHMNDRATMPSPTTTTFFLGAPLTPLTPFNPLAAREPFTTFAPFVPSAVCVVSAWPSVRFTMVVVMLALVRACKWQGLQ